jgi:3'(2'), 5'-bisphosphate nucleotidase
MFETERSIAIELAKQAGAAILPLYRDGTDVLYKAKREPVTEADLTANRIITEGLRRHFPNDAILSEESVDDAERLKFERVWIVDPLDGTKEFVDHVDQFVVMIGLAIQGIPVVGAVYQPVTNRLWHAASGQGAIFEDSGQARPARVGQRTSADGLRLVVARSHHFPGVEELLRKLGITEVHQIGSVGLKVSAIAIDDADCMSMFPTHYAEWDRVRS